MGDYQLIHELCESTVFRSRPALDKMSDKDKEKLLYATLLSVIAGTADTKTSHWAQQYAAKTAAFNNFDFFRPTGTDLYVLLYDATTRGVIGSQKGRILMLLKNLGRGNASQAQIQETLLRLERMMPVDSRLRTARRTIAAWENTTPASRKAAVQNVIISLNSVSRRSEALPYMKILKGGPRGSFGKSSSLKKAAAIAGAGLAGFALGFKSYDPKKKFKFGSMRDSITLDSGNMIAEDRATQLAYLAQKLPEHPAVEKLISVNYLNDGISAFVRTTDGNAYEFEIRPAPHAKGHDEKRSVNESIDMTDETCEKCGEGYYTETSIFDDMDGVLHCSECSYKIDRYAEANDQVWEYRVEESDDWIDDPDGDDTFSGIALKKLDQGNCTTCDGLGKQLVGDDQLVFDCPDCKGTGKF